MVDENVVAMHMSDGIVNLPTSALFGVIAIVGIGFCAWKARAELDERTVPMAGLVAAFIFAVQMINFPILAGVSGHLLGGALAAILVGPFTGALCVAIVLVVQALLFADGGLSALGTNITNMALIGVCVGYGVALLLRPILLRRRTPTGQSLGGLGTVAFLAALCGTVAASLGFVVEYGIGGSAAISLDTVAAYILGTHVLIGIGEGLLTALTVVAVARARPDLVYLLRTAPSPQERVR
ncbi:energy-coupling factor ABC transporter permease [Rhodococcus sp. H36-A4]|uniref:energy-coupling factor ABC transporter permease n=1 Tax=Rhodococcus sp. H36-A4 TaxID=3004353 RepID=UPI0022AFC636|nr:energy-coupling factor ABC transporter permease [Rhodococcus sp. H36-A4]MCZ4077127.1 energy-coupling factor ABC transporter permease [Rhodococcus sp. H36-A4]